LLGEWTPALTRLADVVAELVSLGIDCGSQVDLHGFALEDCIDHCVTDGSAWEAESRERAVVLSLAYGEVGTVVLDHVALASPERVLLDASDHSREVALRQFLLGRVLGRLGGDQGEGLD